MMPASVADRYPMRSRLDPAPRRPRPVLPPRRLPVAAIGISAIGHALVALLVVTTIMWNGRHSSQVHVVNLVPAIAAVGNPTAPAPSPSLPTRPALALPSRAPVPNPTPEPRERAIHEAPRLPEASLPRPSLPPRPGLTRPGEKELPPLAAPTVASRVEKPERAEKPVESRPAPPAARGVPTGSPAGVGTLSLDASDFPYAWYLRQVVQKITLEWERQERSQEPGQVPQIFVEIQRDGSIRAPKIEISSGSSVYDRAVLRAVMDASPFPPLPADWAKPSLRILFSFRLQPKTG